MKYRFFAQVETRTERGILINDNEFVSGIFATKKESKAALERIARSNLEWSKNNPYRMTKRYKLDSVRFEKIL